MTDSMLNPASSAVAATRARVGPMLSGLPGQLNLAMCSPISMSVSFLPLENPAS